MKLFLLIFLSLGLTASIWRKELADAACGRTPAPTPFHRAGEVTARKRSVHAINARKYAVRHGLNTQYCFLVDMSLPSGKNRFFVYNLANDSVENASLVTHGRCNENWLEGRKYGNKIGCGCTSLGKYQVGNPYQGRFGLAYKLSGLDSSNDNAFKRFVVLHSHSCVPAAEPDPSPICQSDGCPTVSASFLKVLAKKIDRSAKPVLLWIYD